MQNKQPKTNGKLQELKNLANQHGVPLVDVIKNYRIMAGGGDPDAPKKDQRSVVVFAESPQQTVQHDFNKKYEEKDFSWKPGHSPSEIKERLVSEQQIRNPNFESTYQRIDAIDKERDELYRQRRIIEGGGTNEGLFRHLDTRNEYIRSIRAFGMGDFGINSDSWEKEEEFLTQNHPDRQLALSLGYANYLSDKRWELRQEKDALKKTIYEADTEELIAANRKMEGYEVDEKSKVFTTEAEDLKKFYKRTEPNTNVRIVSEYGEKMREQLGRINPGEEVHLYGHSGDKFFGLPFDEVMSTVNNSKASECYLGTCYGDKLLNSSDIKSDIPLYSTVKKAWLGVNPNADNIIDAMYSTQPTGKYNEEIKVATPIYGDAYVKRDKFDFDHSLLKYDKKKIEAEQTALPYPVRLWGQSGPPAPNERTTFKDGGGLDEPTVPPALLNSMQQFTAATPPAQTKMAEIIAQEQKKNNPLYTTKRIIESPKPEDKKKSIPGFAIKTDNPDYGSEYLEQIRQKYKLGLQPSISGGAADLQALIDAGASKDEINTLMSTPIGRNFANRPAQGAIELDDFGNGAIFGMGMGWKAGEPFFSVLANELTLGASTLARMGIKDFSKVVHSAPVPDHIPNQSVSLADKIKRVEESLPLKHDAWTENTSSVAKTLEEEVSFLREQHEILYAKAQEKSNIYDKISNQYWNAKDINSPDIEALESAKNLAARQYSEAYGKAQEIQNAIWAHRENIINLTTSVSKEAFHDRIKGITKLDENTSIFSGPAWARPEDGTYFVDKNVANILKAEHSELVDLTKNNELIVQNIENHEVDHLITGDAAYNFYEEVPKAINMEKLASHGNYFTNTYGTEIIARMGQIKDYFGLKATDKLTINDLIHAKYNYVKDVGLDNNMTEFFNAITDNEEFVKLFNKYTLGTAAAVGTASQLNGKDAPSRSQNFNVHTGKPVMYKEGGEIPAMFNQIEPQDNTAIKAPVVPIPAETIAAGIPNADLPNNVEIVDVDEYGFKSLRNKLADRLKIKPSAIDRTMFNISFHETGETLDPKIKNSAGGVARGLYQFQPESVKTAKNRARNLYKSLGEPLPDWVANLDTTDASELTPEQQGFLFLADAYMRPNFDLGAATKDYESSVVQWGAGWETTSNPVLMAQFRSRKARADKKYQELYGK